MQYARLNDTARRDLVALRGILNLSQECLAKRVRKELPPPDETRDKLGGSTKRSRQGCSTATIGNIEKGEYVTLGVFHALQHVLNCACRERNRQKDTIEPIQPTNILDSLEIRPDGHRVQPPSVREFGVLPGVSRARIRIAAVGTASVGSGFNWSIATYFAVEGQAGPGPDGPLLASIQLLGFFAAALQIERILYRHRPVDWKNALLFALCFWLINVWPGQFFGCWCRDLIVLTTEVSTVSAAAWTTALHSGGLIAIAFMLYPRWPQFIKWLASLINTDRPHNQSLRGLKLQILDGSEV